MRFLVDECTGSSVAEWLRNIETLRRLLEGYADQLPGQFVVVTEKRVRFARLQILVFFAQAQQSLAPRQAPLPSAKPCRSDA